MFLDGGWEHMPFGTIEVSDQYCWEPLFGHIKAVAATIGNSRKIWLVIERERERERERRRRRIWQQDMVVVDLLEVWGKDVSPVSSYWWTSRGSCIIRRW
jgi:hypothetical protein